MRGLHETVKVVQAVPPIVTTTAETLFNNTSSGGTDGIDTKDFDELLVEVSFGAVGGVLDVQLFESATNDSSTSTAVADINGVLADFDQFDGTEDNEVHVIRAKAKDLKRFVWVKTINADTTSKTYGINVLLGKADAEPVTQDQTVDFTHGEQ